MAYETVTKISGTTKYFDKIIHQNYWKLNFLLYTCEESARFTKYYPLRHYIYAFLVATSRVRSLVDHDLN